MDNDQFSGLTFGGLVPENEASPDSVYAGYVASQAGVDDSNWGSMIPVGRQASPWQYDTDPLGTKAEAFGKATGQPLTSQAVPYITLPDGSMMSREDAMKYDAGRRLLTLADKNRQGRRRGFLEAITDVGLTDAPFLSLFATVGGSIKEAAEVSDVMKRWQASGELPKEDGLKLQAYMAENEYKAHGTWGAMVGDIVRAAPGFMLEFLSTGAGLSAVRKGLSKAAGGSVDALTTLAVNRGAKNLGRELAEREVVRRAEGALGAGAAEGVSKAAIRDKIRNFTSEETASLVKDVATTLKPYVEKTMGRQVEMASDGAFKVVREGWAPEMIDAVAENLAKKRVASAIAKEGAGNAFSRFMVGAGQTLKDSVARGLLDHGSWGTEEASQLFFNHNSAGRALADAMATFTVEAPIRGSLMFAGNQLVTAPLKAATGAVSDAQLGLQATALRTGDTDLMEKADSIAMGINLMEYVSENAGRGFGSLARAVGLKTGISRTAGRKLIGEAGGLLREADHLQAGGFLRNLIRKAVGTPEEFVARTRTAKVDSVLARMTAPVEQGGLGMTVNRTVASQIVGGSVPSDAAIRAVVGDDVGRFVTDSVKFAMKKKEGELINKTYLKFTLADMMARHNWGPDTVMNLFEKMGYDGIAGEMFEERYSDFAKGLLGLDDKATHSFKENLSRAIDSLYPGFDQLLAEAVGFAVPMVTRAATLKVQQKLGGASQVGRVRAAGSNFQAAVNAQRVVEASLGQYWESTENEIRNLNDEKKKAQLRIDEEMKAISDEGVTDGTIIDARTGELKAKLEDLDSRIKNQEDARRRTLEVNGIAEYSAEIANKIFRVAPVSGTVSASDISSQSKLGVTRSSEQLAEAQGAMDAFVDDVPYIGEALFDAASKDPGESLPLWRRIAGKVAGFAGAVICGEPALAASNVAEWASVDDGLDPNVAFGLKSLFKEHRDAAIKRIEKRNAAGGTPGGYKISEEEIRAEMRPAYEKAAKDFARRRLALSGVRMFSQSEMLDKAAIYHARLDGWQYDPESRTFSRRNDEGVRETTSLAEFAERNADKVNKTRDDIAKQTLRILTDGTVTPVDFDNRVVSLVNLKTGSAIEDKVATRLALEMSGFGQVITSTTLEDGMPLEAQLGETSTILDGPVVSRIASTTIDKVDDADIAQVAKQMRFKVNTGTEEDIASMRRQIYDTCRQLAVAVDPTNTVGFVRDISTDTRLYDSPTQSVIGTRRGDGKWHIVYDTAPGKESTFGKRVHAEFDTREQMIAEMTKPENGFRQAERGAQFVQASILRTTDPLLLAKKLGIAKDIFDRTLRVVGRDSTGAPVYDYSSVPPAWRRRSDGAFVYSDTVNPGETRSEAQRQMDRELRLAQEYANSGFGSDLSKFDRTGHDSETEKVRRRDEAKAAYEAAYDNERGYMKVIESVLRAAQCTTPTSEQLSLSLVSGTPAEYTCALRSFTAHAQSLKTFIPIDFLAAQDYSSAIMNAALVDSFARYRRLIDSKGPYHKTLCYFVKAVDSIAERHMWDVNTPEETRKNLMRFRQDLTAAYWHPSARTFQTLASEFALFRVERDRTAGVNQTAHSAAAAAIATDVRNSPEFIPFIGLVDLMLGGDGFSFEAARRSVGAKAGGVPLTGIARIMEAFDDTGNRSFQDALREFRPFGMEVREFVERVNRYARDLNLKPAAQVTEETKVPESVPGLLSVVKKAFSDAGFRDEKDIEKALLAIGTAAFRNKNGKVTRAKMGTVRERVAEFNEIFAKLNGQVADLTRAAADKDAEIKRAQADRQLQVEALNEKRKELEDAQAKLRDAKALLEKYEKERALREAKLKNAAVDAGNVSGTNVEDAVAPDDTGFTPSAQTQENPFANDPGLASMFRDRESISIRDSEGDEVFTPTYLVPLDDGTVEIREAVTEASDLTEDDLPYGANIVRNFMRVTGKSEDSVEDFKAAAREFFPSINEVELDALWNMNKSEILKRNSDAKNSEEINAEADDQDGEEEGTHSANTLYGSKDAAAYDNKPLNCFLAFCNLASPETKRNLQAFFNNVRDNVASLKSEVTEEQKGLYESVALLDKLLNPRALVDDAVKSTTDREAVFSARVRDLLDGENGVTIDSMINALMEKNVHGHPYSRKGAFFLSYLRSLTPASRRNMLHLICNSAVCSKASVRIETTYSGDKSAEKHLCFTPQTGNYQTTSETALTASFMPFMNLSKEQLAEKISSLKELIKANAEGFTEPSGEGVGAAIVAIRHNFKTLRKVLAPFLGHESPLVQAISSEGMLDYLRYEYECQRNRKYAKGEVSPAANVIMTLARQSSPKAAKYSRGNDRTPELLTTIIDVLEAYADDPKQDGNREALSRISVAAFEAGIAKGEGLVFPVKTSGSDTGWMRVLSAYSASLPETIARAENLPERTSKIGSTVAISSRGVVPIVAQWMDKGLYEKNGETGEKTYNVDSFAYMAKNFLGGKAGNALREMSDEDFEAKVLPRCRQTMTWPDGFHTPILAKNVSKDYTADEVIEGCKWSFNNKFAPIVKGNADLHDMTKGEVGRWYVPVYSGDHSAGVILQLPKFVGADWFGDNVFNRKSADYVGYTGAADHMCAAIGLKKLGTDTKRSALSSNEAPGMSMRGASVKDGKITYGECRLCVFKNFSQDMQFKGGDESFIGTIPAVGYGVRQQQACAKDQKSQTLKLHFLSTTGEDLTMLKGLTLAVDEDAGKNSGSFVAGSATKAISDHIVNIHSGLKHKDLSTVLALDFDAIKVGVGNSKNEGVMVGGKQMPLFKYVFDRIAANGVKSYSGSALDKILADGAEDGKFSWHNSVTGVTERKTIGELIGVEGGYDGDETDSGVRVDVVKGLNGDSAISLSYVDNSLMSYTVANVSHEAKPSVGRTPRNNMIDAITMAAVQLRGGLSDGTDDQLKGILDIVSNWGVLSSVLNTDDASVQAVARQSEAIRDLFNRGEAPGGLNYEEQLARDVFKRLNKALNIPMYKIDCALVTSGAVYDDQAGKVADNTKDPLLRQLHLGSRVFTRADAKFYGAKRRLGMAQINVQNDGFRYGWFLDRQRLGQLLGDAKSNFKSCESWGKGVPEDRNVIVVLEDLFTAVHDADLDHVAKREAMYSVSPEEAQDAYKEYVAARDKARRMRMELLQCFKDHHGFQIHARQNRFEKENSPSHGLYAWSVGFDDLFTAVTASREATRKSSDGRGFDRSSVYLDMPGKDGPSVFLAGTTFGLPRTPSYNGSMWLQTVRASLPATEIEYEDKTFSCGRDAMVMPDPQSLKILGCDHDGDKAQCYMYVTDVETGVSSATDIPEPGSELTGAAFAKDGNEKRNYLERCVSSGLVRKTTLKGSADEGYRLTKDAKNRVSNRFVQGLFDMSRNLEVVADDKEHDFYRMPMSNGTKAAPLNDEFWDKLKEVADKSRNFMKGHTLGEAFPAAHVATSSQSADRARGMVVSLASMLHLAQFSGKFGPNSPAGQLFTWTEGNYRRWIDFMYHFDGISNATFDDIKEQICGRLGWTNGMMDTVLIDLITSGGKVPSNDIEFYNSLKKYVESVANHGSRYYMMVSSEPANNNAEVKKVHDDIREMFAAKRDSIYRDDVAAFFGIKKIGKRYRFRRGNTDLAPAAREFVESLIAYAKTVEGRIGIPDKTDSEDYALRRLIADVSHHKGDNAGSGFVFWAVRAIKDGGVDAADAAEQYFKWSKGRQVLTVVREFSNSINFTKADPGSGTKVGRREELSRRFADTMEKGRPDQTVDGILRKMNTATMCAYNVPRLRTRQGRMSLAANTRDYALVQLAKEVARRPGASKALRETVVKLFASNAYPPNSLLNLEGNLQTVPYFLAALQTMQPCKGTDVMSGRNGEAAWDTMRDIADAVAEFMTDRPGEKGNTLSLRCGIEAMYDVMYALVASSDANVRCPAFMYVASRKDRKFGTQRKGTPQYAFGAGLRDLSAAFRNKDSDSVARSQIYISRVMAGELDPDGANGKRRALFAKTGSAEDFTLSKANLAALASEAGDNVSDALAADIRVVQRIVEKMNARYGNDVSITPSMMFSQFLPLYSVFTTRTTGTPKPGDASLVSLIPGLYAKLSKRQALLDTGVLDFGDRMPTGQALLDIVCSSNLCPVDRLVNELIAKKNGPAKPMRELDPETVNLVLSELSSIDPDKIPEAGLGEDPHAKRALDALIGANREYRGNPDGRHLIDVLGCGGLLKSLHEYANESVGGSVAEPEERSDTGTEREIDELTVVQPGEVNEDVKNLASAIQSVVGSWANVSYEGGDTFTISSKKAMSGTGAYRFSNGNGVNAVIRVHVGAAKEGERKLDVNSPEVAASFCEAAKSLNITPEQFMRLFKDEREALVKCYAKGAVKNGCNDFSMSVPEWSIDGKGVATLAGMINIGNAKNAGKLYHEYFHSMIGMFRMMDMFTDADVKTLQERFGKPAAGVNELFNEEAAAEEFRRYVESKVRGRAIRTDKDGKDFKLKRGALDRVYAIFETILDTLTSIYNAIKNGFSYSESKEDTTLFDLVISGTAQMSNEKMMAVVPDRKRKAFEVLGGAMTDEARAKWMEQSLKFAGTMNRELDRMLPTEPGAERTAAEAKDPMAGRDESKMTPMERQLHNLLLNELDRYDETGAKLPARKTAVNALVNELNAIRGGESYKRGEGPVYAIRRSLKTGLPEDETADAMSAALDTDPLVGIATPSFRLGEAVFHEALGIADKADAALLAEINAKGSWCERLRLNTEVSDAVRALNERRIKTIKLGIREAGEVTGVKLGGSAYNMICRAYAYLMSHSKNQVDRLDRTFPTSDNDKSVASKSNLTTSDCVGFLMASGGETPEMAVNRLVSRLDAERVEGTHAAAVIDTLIDRLHEYSFDETTILSDGFRDDVSAMMSDTFTGIKRAKWDDAKGDYGEYLPSTDASDLAERNRQLYGLASEGADSVDKASRAKIQKCLRMFADTVCGIAAAVKFYREIGFQPGTWHDTAFTGRNVPPVSFAEVTGNFGIGKDNLLRDDPIVEFNNQPQFIMANMDDWLAGSVREHFGNEGLRELFMKNSAEFRGIVAKLNRIENWNACYFGINRLEGQKLLKLVKYGRTHEMRDGFFRSTDKGEALGFDASSGARGQVTDISFTEDEYRTVDLFLKSLSVRANGGTKYLTGISGFRFSIGMTAYGERRDGDDRFYLTDREEDYTWEKVSAYVRDFYKKGTDVREIPSPIMALYNLGLQWHDEVKGKVKGGTDTAPQSGLDIYNRFVKSMCAGIARGWELNDDAVMSGGSFLTPDVFNDVVLSELEKDGLVVCERSDESAKDADGYRLRRTGVICMGVREIEDMFRTSTAYRKLIDAGRDPGMLDGDATVKRYMEPYRQAIAEVRKHPWLTTGDGKFFNNFATPLPFFHGNGGFMYHANRAVRSPVESSEIRLGKHEATFLKMCANRKLKEKWLDELSLPMLSMIHDYFGTKEEGEALRNAILNGEYAVGSKKGMATGFEVEDHYGFTDIQKLIYGRLLERRLQEAEGRPSDYDDAGSIERMIRAYEESAETTGSLAGAMGLTDEQMFSMHGALPANMQLGHKIHTTLKGIADALYFRSTLANMLMTKGPDLKPVFYAMPSANAVEAGGVPDSFWGAVAKWWAECNEGLHYDIGKSGVENARAMYSLLKDMRSASNNRKRLHGRNFSELSSDEIDAVSIEAVMAAEDDPEDTGKSKLNKLAGNKLHYLDGGEAIGYAKHLFQSSRVLGSSAKMKTMNQVMAWSKSASVAFSFFFPLATKFESPIAAVGAMATLGSNFDADFMRRHADGLKKIQSLLSGGNGWLTSDFIGYKDIMRMMDTDDPFLSDLVMWAEALGISMSDRLMNPMEETKGVVEADIRKVVNAVRASMGSKAASQMDAVMNAMFLRSGEKAFTYALNATKLAVTCQVAMKLKTEAEKRGKAFDPIRDLRKYAGYIDSEIGGVNPLRYAWAHPEMRAMMNAAMFSWQWTRTAWEAGGGTLFEDMIFGGHAFNKETRNYILGRWLRMFGTVMIGVPMMMQMLIKALALAMGRDDDDDKWFTWQNEDKTCWTAFDLTPLLKAIGDMPDCAGRGRNGYEDLTWFGKGVNAVASNVKKAPVLGKMVPGYTGEDAANKTTRNRRYYMHFGKQGWEFFRWFMAPGQQFFSKLSMPVQRMMEGVLGRNMSYLDRELDWADMGVAERWIAPNGAGVNLAKAFLPFTFNGISTFGDAGALSMFGPVQMGASQSVIIDRMKVALDKWAENDRAGYAYGGKKRGKNRDNLSVLLSDVIRDAKLNGHDPDEMMTRAIGQLTSKYYGRLFDAMPENPEDDYDVREVEKCVRAIHRLGRKYKDTMSSLKKRLKKYGESWDTMPGENRAAIRSSVRTADADPFGLHPGAAAEAFRQDADAQEYLEQKRMDY